MTVAVFGGQPSKPAPVVSVEYSVYKNECYTIFRKVVCACRKYHPSLALNIHIVNYYILILRLHTWVSDLYS